MYQQRGLSNLSKLINYSNVFRIESTAYHTSGPRLAGQEWRKKKCLPANPNAYGLLTDLPDYTYIDGRMAPVGTGKIRRAKEQEEYAKKIIELTSEVDFAVERRKELLSQEEAYKQSIIDRKLNAKNFKNKS